MRTESTMPSTRSSRGRCLGMFAAAVTVFATPFHVQGGGNPPLIPPQANYRGLSYGEWGAEFFKSQILIPVVDDSHPFFTGEPYWGHKGMLFLCAVPPDPEPVVIDVTIPAGTPIFCPVIWIECSTIEEPPYHGDNEEELRACANALMDETSGLFAEIDGIPVTNLETYRAESPLFEFGPLPDDNLFAYLGADVPAGTTALSVAAGVYLLLPPFSVGKHSIHVGGMYGPSIGDVPIDTVFNITVVSR